MQLLYDFLFFCLLLFFVPVYLCKGKLHHSIFQRLNPLPKVLLPITPIWLHAVSVGEVNAIRALLPLLRKNYPGKEIVISTVTPTGQQVAKGLRQDADLVTYLPLDFSFLVKPCLDQARPSLFIIVETEIWPNLIYYLAKNKIPIALVNARISDKSFQGYRIFKFFFAPVLRRIDLICCQSTCDAEKLIALGAGEDKIKITGNMKFDSIDYGDYKNDYSDYRLKLSLRAEEKLLVAGSTHPGEEEIIIAAYRELLPANPNLRLLIAPRHPQRAKEVARLVEKFSFPYTFISNLFALTPIAHGLRPNTIFILDTIGELVAYYAAAAIVFVGGSLINKGGQNILEPAIFSRPIIFGPHMHNFRATAELFLKENCAIMVYNKEDFRQAIEKLLADPEGAAELGRRAKDLVEKNKGAAGRTMEQIWKLGQGKIMISSS